jgi:hypothetical protein
MVLRRVRSFAEDVYYDSNSAWPLPPFVEGLHVLWQRPDFAMRAAPSVTSLVNAC